MIAFFYYGNVARVMFFNAPTVEDRTPVRIPTALMSGIGLSLLLVVVVGVYPQLFARLGELTPFTDLTSSWPAGSAATLAERIRRHGPLPFDAYVETVLYDPVDGFYGSGRGAGRQGADFITSPEVGGLFGVLVARQLDRWWDELGRPDPFVVVEAGAGRGVLCRDVLRAARRARRALRYVLVERSAALAARQQELVALEPAAEELGALAPVGEAGPDPDEERPLLRGIGPRCCALDRLPALRVDGVVIANELLDNLPFRVVVRTPEGWDEVRIGVDAGGALVEVVVPAADELAARADALDRRHARARRAPGCPCSPRWRSWVAAACALLRRGWVACVDYAATLGRAGGAGGRRPAGLAAHLRRATGGAATCSRAPARDDVTVDVVVDVFERAARRAGATPVPVRTQADWLRRPRRGRPRRGGRGGVAGTGPRRRPRRPGRPQPGVGGGRPRRPDRPRGPPPARRPGRALTHPSELLGLVRSQSAPRPEDRRDWERIRNLWAWCARRAHQGQKIGAWTGGGWSPPGVRFAASSGPVVGPDVPVCQSAWSARLSDRGPMLPDDPVARQLVERSRRADGSLTAAVVGIAGSGKSELLDHLEVEARSSGARVLRAQGRRSEQSLPFGALEGPLEADDVAALADGDGGTAPASGPARSCWPLRRPSPRVLLVDDAQWLDGASLATLLAVAERADTHPVRLVSAHRPGQRPRRARRARRGAGAPGHPYRHATVRRGDDGQRRLRPASASPPSPGLVDVVQTLTEGVPLYVSRLTRGWLADGAIFGGELRGRPPLPASVVETVRTRIEQVSPEAQPRGAGAELRVVPRRRAARVDHRRRAGARWPTPSRSCGPPACSRRRSPTCCPSWPRPSST